jgi:hypothetical protein
MLAVEKAVRTTDRLPSGHDTQIVGWQGLEIGALSHKIV